MVKLAALLTLIPAAFAVSSPSVDGSIQLEIVQGFPLVKAYVNGQGPFRMLLDTGGQSCKLSLRVARKMGLQPDERVVLATSVGEQIVAGVKSTDVAVGDLKLGGVEVLIASTDALEQAGISADGVLGQSFLRKTPYLIDYRAKRLYLGDAARERSEALEEPLNGKITADRVTVEVNLSQTSNFLMTLDSGASNLVLWCRTGCPGRTVAQSGYRVDTMAGSAAVDVRELAGLRVGNSQIGRQSLVVLPGERNAAEDGLLPARLFSQVYVDTAQAVVRVK